MNLNTLSNNPGAKQNSKRLGRGIGSGKGKTCGRGVKGQKARSGVAIKGFEGGQMPLIKRLPKRGFHCPTTKTYQVISLLDIANLIASQRLDASQVVTKESLVKARVIKNTKALVKLLSSPFDIKQKLEIKLDSYSKSAREMVLKSGGQIL